MNRLGVVGAVVALLALSACGNKEREKKEQEAAAAEKKLADARSFQEQLEKEKALLAPQLAEVRARLAQVRTAHRETLAAAAFLAENSASGLKPDADMEAAREGFQLAQAARAKDREAITELATRVLDDVRPCERAETGEGGGDICPPCDVDPYEDVCEGVETQLSTSPDWLCSSVARTGEGLPPAAFCTSTVEHPAPGGAVGSPYAEQSLPTELQVVRIAFVHQGRLFASDYPPPDTLLYNPPNVEPLVSCQAATERNKCIHECEVRFDRYEDPCMCQDTKYHQEYGDTEEPESSDEEGEGEEEEEPFEVRQAREAAAAAEAEAETARLRAEEARIELEYQECLTACEPEEDPPRQEAEGEGEPGAAQVVVSLEGTPAPGVFLVARESRSLLKPGGNVLGQERLWLVLKHAELAALWEKKPLPAQEALGKLEVVGKVEEPRLEGGKPSLAPLPGHEGPALVGLLGGQVQAFVFGTKPGQAPVTVLSAVAACEAVRAEPKGFPESFLKACPEPTPAPPPEAAPAATPEPTPPAAAPPAAAPEDAGTTGTPAGEVSP